MLYELLPDVGVSVVSFAVSTDPLDFEFLVE